MSSPSSARRLHDSLDTAELRETVIAATGPRRTAWSVVVPERDGAFSTLLSSAGRSGPVPPEVARTLAAILGDAGERLAPVSASVPGGEGPVRAAAALRFRDETYGLFLLHGEDAAELDGWQEIVDALSPEIVKLQLYEAANRESTTSAVKLDALHEAGNLVQYVELDVLLTKLMELAVRIMRADVGAIVLVRDGDITPGIEWGLTESLLRSLRTADGRPFLESALARGECVVIPDAAHSADIDVSGLAVNLKSLVLVPLLAQGKALGAIAIVNAGGEEGVRSDDADVLRTVANLCAAAVDNAILYGKTRESERISAEMNLAASIQNGLLPSSYPENAAFELRGWCMSATETGGDFYDYFEMDGERTGIVVGDATGHGMGAALMVFIARSSLRALLTSSRDLRGIMERMNDLVEADCASDRFLTFFFGTFHHETRVLEFTSAGHDPPFIYRPAEDRFLDFDPTGIPLGIFAGSEYPTTAVTLQPGDLLLFGTDGIWEAADPKGTLFGKDRVRAAIRSHHALTLPAFSERIRKEILAYHEGAERRDDITAVFLRVK